MIVNGTDMSMVRGDTESITIKMQDKDGVKVPFVDGDILYMTVKRSGTTTRKILQKVVNSFTDGNAEIFISSEDTKNIPFLEYVYDIQVNRIEDGSITTIIPASKFVLNEEITYE